MDLCAAVLQTSRLVLIKSRMKQHQGQSGEQCRGKHNQLFVEITDFGCLLVRVAIAKKGAVINSFYNNISNRFQIS